MNSHEKRVRRALHHHAGSIEPGDESPERIHERVDEARRRRRHRWAGGATAAVAAAVLLVVAVASLGGDGARVVESGPAATNTSATPPDPSVEDPPPAPPDDTPSPGVWPFHTAATLEAYLDSGDTRYDDPAEVARAFASEYLGMVDPVVGEPSGPGPDGTLDVVVQPHGEGGRVLEPGVLETTIKLDPVGPPWSVLYATSADILLDGPVSGREVTSPVTVTGESRAFEGTVDVEVREDGMGAGEALGRGFVTGGAGPDLGSFSGEVSFEPASTDQGALVLFTTSAADGSVQQATVVDISLPAPGTTEVTVYFHRTEELVPVTRTVPATTGVLRASLEQLLAGPTEVERTSGVSSWFSEATTGMLNDVTLDADGTAVVDLGDLRSVIPNASTSTGSTLLLEQLNATVFQFSTVERVGYRLEGSCDAFFEWLQRGCEVIERPGG